MAMAPLNGVIEYRNWSVRAKKGATYIIHLPAPNSSHKYGSQSVTFQTVTLKIVHEHMNRPHDGLRKFAVGADRMTASHYEMQIASNSKEPHPLARHESNYAAPFQSMHSHEHWRAGLTTTVTAKLTLGDTLETTPLA